MSAIDSPATGTLTASHVGYGAERAHKVAPDSQPQNPGPVADVGSRRTNGRLVILAIVLTILFAVLWVGPDRVATFANRMLQTYLQAQQNMLAATGNLNADGRAEFAVLLSDGASPSDLRAAIAGIDEVSFAREADLSGWVVVTMSAGNRAALKALLALPQARLVVPNRGLWICH